MFIPGVGELTIALDLASAVALGGKWGIDMGEVQAGEGSVKAVVEDTSQALALAAGVKVGTLEHREFLTRCSYVEEEEDVTGPLYGPLNSNPPPRAGGGAEGIRTPDLCRARG
jgi:hypothetical protein